MKGMIRRNRGSMASLWWSCEGLRPPMFQLESAAKRQKTPGMQGDRIHAPWSREHVPHICSCQNQIPKLAKGKKGKFKHIRRGEKIAAYIDLASSETWRDQLTPTFIFTDRGSRHSSFLYKIVFDSVESVSSYLCFRT